MKPVRMMVIGVGQWGQNWIENIQADPYFEVAALVDADRGKMELACSKFNLEEKICFMDLEKAISDASPDAAIIVVPPEMHYAVAMTCIRRNLQVLSEKPLANNIKEALEIKQACETQKILFMVSQDYRWQPPIQALRDSIAKGSIGKPGYAIYNHFQALKIGGWREQMENVILEDMAIHHFDILRYIMGIDCLEVFADSFNPSWSWYRGGAATSVLLKFEQDFRVNYFATWVTPGEEDSWPGEIRIEGEKGSISLNARGEVTLNCMGRTSIVHQPVMAKVGRAFALTQFRSGIARESLPESVISDNIKSYAIVRAAIKSIQTGQPVRVEPLLQPE